MMNAELRRYLLLFANVVAVVCSVSGTDIPVIYVCEEESVQVFQNINFDCCKSSVHLTRKNKRIADWSFKNCVLNATFETEYDHRFSLHTNGTITMQNIQSQDSGEYDVIYQNDNLPPLIYEVQIYVMVAPTKDCKPSVTNTGNVLKATVNPSGCGEPIVNAYWKCLNNAIETERTLLNVDAGTKPCAYQVCIEGPALQCIRDVSHRNYCFPSTSTTQDTKPPLSSETYSNGLLAGLVIVIIIFVASFIVNVIQYLKGSGKCATKCKTNRNERSNVRRQSSEEESDEESKL